MNGMYIVYLQCIFSKRSGTFWTSKAPFFVRKQSTLLHCDGVFLRFGAGRKRVLWFCITLTPFWAQSLSSRQANKINVIRPRLLPLLDPNLFLPRRVATSFGFLLIVLLAGRVVRRVATSFSFLLDFLLAGSRPLGVQDQPLVWVSL